MTALAVVPPVMAPGAVTFSVTSYRYDQAAGGMSQAGRVRQVRVDQALTAILDDLPIDATMVANDAAGQITTIVIDWSRVPDQVKRPYLAGG